LATKNNRNARMLLCATLGGTYVAVSKSHGLKLKTPIDFSEDTSHGDRFKSRLPGIQDFSATLTAWYNSTYTTLEGMSVNRVSEYIQIYPDFTDTVNYIRGQCYVSQSELDLDLGSTAGEGYDVMLANSDLDIIRAGVTILT
jgi:hypothetical protein